MRLNLNAPRISALGLLEGAAFARQEEFAAIQTEREELRLALEEQTFQDQLDNSRLGVDLLSTQITGNRLTNDGRFIQNQFDTQNNPLRLAGNRLSNQVTQQTLDVNNQLNPLRVREATRNDRLGVALLPSNINAGIARNGGVVADATVAVETAGDRIKQSGINLETAGVNLGNARRASDRDIRFGDRQARLGLQLTQANINKANRPPQARSVNTKETSNRLLRSLNQQLRRASTDEQIQTIQNQINQEIAFRQQAGFSDRPSFLEQQLSGSTATPTRSIGNISIGGR